ncbi:MAG TPA: histidine phosphatase family protein [Flavisolibacter sp.]|nr:histidine phosphatase family protein [Flavisolibacter sp.]
MKTILLIRHAKSSWDHPGMDDADRPLNERGKKDAPEMARRLKEKGIRIGLFVSSPAKRAKKTAKYFAEAYGLEKDAIVLIEALYHAPPSVFAETIAALPGEHSTVAIFAHNPGITEFASSLTDVRIDNMPTCSVFAVSADAGSWEDFMKGDKKFLFFDYPKNPQH